MNKSEQLIACLEGEIAKRDDRINTLCISMQMDAATIAAKDARIVELEAKMAALKAQEPVAWISKDGTYAEASTKSTVYGSHTLPLYAEPVPVENAQVVMPERWNVPRPMWKDARQPYGNPLNHADIEAAEKFNLALDEVARLNAAPVQQVSVPDGKVCVPVEVLRLYEFMEASFTPFTVQHEQIAISLRRAKAAMLAAPAAPAADAGLVEALDRIARSATSHIEQGERPDLVTVSHWAHVAYSAIDAHSAKGVL